MRKKYRIKRACTWVRTKRGHLYCPTYIVQVHVLFGIWIRVKSFRDEDEPDFARREAEELLDKLNEK